MSGGERAFTAVVADLGVRPGERCGELREGRREGRVVVAAFCGMLRVVEADREHLSRVRNGRTRVPRVELDTLRENRVLRPVHELVEPDGYIAVVDEKGPRIVADGLCWPNEIRFDANQRFAYVPETFGRRVMRFEVGDDAVLRNRRVWGPDPLSETSAPDGIALDADGNVWIAIISRNGLVIIDGSGDAHTVFEDPNDVALTAWLDHLDSGVIPMSTIRDCAGPRLQLPTSVGFCGQDLRTVVMGSLAMSSLLTFRSPTAGLPLAHQARPQAPPQPAVVVRPRTIGSRCSSRDK